MAEAITSSNFLWRFGDYEKKKEISFRVAGMFFICKMLHALTMHKLKQWLAQCT